VVNKGEAMHGKYGMRVGEFTEYSSAKNLTTEDLQIRVGTLEQCKKIIEIAKIKTYQILDYEADSKGTVIEQTPDITAYLERVAREKGDYDQRQREKAERINRLPEKFPMDIGEDRVEFYVERSEAAYRASYSGGIQYGVGLFCKVFSSGSKVDIWENDIKNKEGKLKKKHFIDHYGHLFKKTNPLDAMPKLLAKLREVRELCKNA
jgi:hypothetical protein